LEIPESRQIPIDFDYAGAARTFFVPDSANQVKTVREIFSGETFPTPPFDRSSVDCVFDIGANIGAASVYFSLNYPNAQVHSFEPNTYSLPILE